MEQVEQQQGVIEKMTLKHQVGRYAPCTDTKCFRSNFSAQLLTGS